MKKAFLINLLLLLTLNNAFSSEDRDFSKGHGFLPKDTTSMKTVFEIDDVGFDKVFPSCLHNIEEQGEQPNYSVCLLRNKYAGTATIIENDNKNVTALTAAHNLKDKDNKGNILFGTLFQGSARSNNKDEKISHIARYDINTVCFHDEKDIALIKGTLVESPFNYDILKQYTSDISSEKDNQKQTGTMYHHPLGFKDQRVGLGEVDCDGKHYISTLPGSSGASIFNENGKIMCIHTGGDEEIIKSVVYNGNRLKKLGRSSKTCYMYNNNLCDIITQNDLAKFNTCFKKNDI